MSANPRKTPCSVPGCKAWAIRATDPPLCAAHAHRNAGAGAPAGNQNARTHGFYSTALELEELADLVACADDLSLDDEIALTRVLLRRLMEQIHRTPAGDDAEPTDYVRIAGLALQAARTVARLLRDKRAIAGEAADGLQGAISQILDEFSTEWGVEL